MNIVDLFKSKLPQYMKGRVRTDNRHDLESMLEALLSVLQDIQDQIDKDTTP